MAHGIQTTDNLTFRKNGGTPWHGIGYAIEDGQTAVEVVENPNFGLNWTHELQPVEAVLPDGSRIFVPETMADVRLDTRTVLGTVSDGYSVVQNRELAEFADSIVGEDAVAQVETFGTIHGGRRVFITMKLPSIAITGDDIVNPYVVLSNGNGGHAGLSAVNTAVRVVCANTQRLADRDVDQKGIRFVHRGDMKAKIEAARVILGFAKVDAVKFEAQAKAMAAMQLTVADARTFFERSFEEMLGKAPKDADALGKWLAKRDETVNRFIALMDNERNAMPGIRGTLWSAYNAVTEWVDHGRSSGRVTGEKRLESNLFGTNAMAKDKVWSLSKGILVPS